MSAPHPELSLWNGGSIAAIFGMVQFAVKTVFKIKAEKKMNSRKKSLGKIILWKLSHAIMEAEKSNNMLSKSWRTREAAGVIQQESKSRCELWTLKP